MENLYYTALYKVTKRLDFLLDFCIVKNREKNLVVWPRLKIVTTMKLLNFGETNAMSIAYLHFNSRLRPKLQAFKLGGA